LLENAIRETDDAQGRMRRNHKWTKEVIVVIAGTEDERAFRSAEARKLMTKAEPNSV
jgi:hypothetical protein